MGFGGFCQLRFRLGRRPARWHNLLILLVIQGRRGQEATRVIPVARGPCGARRDLAGEHDRLKERRAEQGAWAGVQQATIGKAQDASGRPRGRRHPDPGSA